MKVCDEYWDIIGRKKWVISPKHLIKSDNEWAEFKKQKLEKGVKVESLKRYERDRQRLKRLIEVLEKERKRARRPVKPPSERKREIEEKYHKTHIFVFRCKVPIWSDFSMEKEHYVAYKVVKDAPPNHDIVLRLHNRDFPDHQVISYYYYKTLKVKE